MLMSSIWELKMSPSSNWNSRRMTLSRGVGLPGKSVRRAKYVFAFVGGEGEIDVVGCGEDPHGRFGEEVPIAEHAVNLAQLLDALGHLFTGEGIADAHAKIPHKGVR